MRWWRRRGWRGWSFGPNRRIDWFLMLGWAVLSWEGLFALGLLLNCWGHGARDSILGGRNVIASTKLSHFQEWPGINSADAKVEAQGCHCACQCTTSNIQRR